MQSHHTPHSVLDAGPSIWLLKSYIAPLGMLLLLETHLPLIPSTQEKIVLLLLGNILPGTIFLILYLCALSNVSLGHFSISALHSHK